MSDLIYRIRPESSLSHAYTSKYKDRKQTAERRTSAYADTKSVFGRTASSKYGAYKAPTKNKGQYKSKYYDPVARHERYLKERDLKGGSGGGRGSGSGSGRGSSGKKGRGGRGNLSKAINKLREESQMNSATQQEVTKRKIEDLKAQLNGLIQNLRNSGSKELEEGHNSAEIRGAIQSVRQKIKQEGYDLSDWLKKEQTSLSRRIAKLQGKKYDEGAEKRKKQQQEAKDKEVKQRADAIYKRKTGN